MFKLCSLQDSIDLFLGNFVVGDENEAHPMRQEWDWRYAAVSIDFHYYARCTVTFTVNNGAYELTSFNRSATNGKIYAKSRFPMFNID